MDELTKDKQNLENQFILCKVLRKESKYGLSFRLN